MLSASVAFLVKTIRRASSIPKSSARVSLASRMIRAAARERRWPERPGLPPISSAYRTIATVVAAGFGQEVAALSK